MRAGKRHSELKREKAWSRINLVPLLLAEQDRDAYRRQQAALAREKEIMKDYPGWEVRRVMSFRWPLRWPFAGLIIGG